MKIDISDIISVENKEMSKKAEIELLDFHSRMGKFPIVNKSSFSLHFSNVEKKLLKIEGSTQVDIEIPCDRCLNGVRITFPITINKELSIADLLEHSNSGENEEFHYITGTELDVDKLIFGEILVDWPMKVLCNKDCKGICNKCGCNLNSEECECDRAELDPRMAAIQDIFNKFKEV